MSKLTSLSKLSLTDMGLTVEAAANLAFARFLVAFVPTRHWSTQFDRGVASDNMDEARRDRASKVSRAVRRAARNYPIDMVCLPQAMAARWMLKRRGILSQIYFGMKLPPAEREFHAWLKIDQQWITGHCKESEFAVLEHPGQFGRPSKQTP
ncbi:MAG: lasso peptide biosynthesis B2 protein [Pseudomonadota bacterium]